MVERHFEGQQEESCVSAGTIFDSFDDDGGLIDEELRKCGQKLLDLFDKARTALGYPIFSVEEKYVFIRELFREYVRYFGMERNDGTSIFYNHLVGSVEILTKMGFVRLEEVLAMLKHDVREDFKGDPADLVKSLVDTGHYGGHPDASVGGVANRVIYGVEGFVGGVTKLRRDTRRATTLATLRAHMEAALTHPQVVPIKAADRLHNLFTLDGHGDSPAGLEKKRAITEETVDIYLPMALDYRLRDVVRLYVGYCLGHLNPQLINDFEGLYGGKIDSRISETKRMLSRTLRLSHELAPMLGNPMFVPRWIDDYIVGTKKPFDALRIEDVRKNISRLDPMFEIVFPVIPQDISPLDIDYPIHAREAMMDALSYIMSRVVSSSGASVSFDIPEIGDPLETRGIQVVAYGRQTGGQLNIRINDVVSEARSKRGVLANSDKLPESIRAYLLSFLARTIDSGSGRRRKGAPDVLDVARRELLKPRILVKCLDGQLKELPIGATGLDFAVSVHRDILIGLQRVWVKTDVDSTDLEEEVFPFDGLEDGKLYIVDSCLSGASIDRSKINVSPSWILFCQAPARNAIRAYLRRRRSVPPEETGAAYLKQLSELFGVTKKYYTDLLFRNCGAKDWTELRKMIGTGLINPVEILSRVYQERIVSGSEDEVRDTVWAIEVVLPDRPGQLDILTSEFSEEVGINIHHFEHIKGDSLSHFDRAVIQISNVEESGMSIYDFFKFLLKLSFKYPIKILKNPYRVSYSTS